ncbi:ankyrin repeat domain-containing protein 10a isoform 2-T2 [Polymixia lowei]
MCLVQVGCEVNTVTTRFAQTPTHIAAFGGHPECILWLLQAGADINRQDYVGEAPIHKAARAGSMECIKALLIQGAKPHLRNTSGLTAADLAYAQGFQECFQLLSNAQNRLIQLNGSHANGALNGSSRLCHSQGLFNGVSSRKRLLDDTETVHLKKARTDNDDTQTLSNGHNGPTDSSTNGHCNTLPQANTVKAAPLKSFSTPSGLTAAGSPENELSSMLASQESAEGTTQHRSADMCGSLHLTGSPSSCVSHRPTWGMMASDFADSLHYGHYHGFGDTAEDLNDTSSHLEHCTSIQAEQCYNQAVVSAAQLYHGS